MSDRLWENSLNSPVYLSQSSYFSSSLPTLLLPLSASSEFISEPWPPLSHTLNFFHVILLPHQPFSPPVTHLLYTTFFLIWWKTEKFLQNKMNLTRVMCMVMDGRTGFFFSTELFVYFCCCFGPLRIVISFGRNEERRNPSPPGLRALVLCDPGHFGGLDKIFIPLIPKLTQWCVKNQAMFHSTDHLMGSLL